MIAIYLSIALTAAIFVPIFVIRHIERVEKRKKRKKRKKRPRDILDDLLDLEFCPEMGWLFDVLYSQRRQFMRTCSRFAAVRHRVDDWRVDILVQAIEDADKALEHNVGQILNLVIMAGFNPKLGFHQPNFKKEHINRPALRSYLGENADILEKLDELITTGVESSWVRAEVTASEIEAWSSGFKHMRDFAEDFKESSAA